MIDAVSQPHGSETRFIYGYVMTTVYIKLSTQNLLRIFQIAIYLDQFKLFKCSQTCVW